MKWPQNKQQYYYTTVTKFGFCPNRTNTRTRLQNRSSYERYKKLKRSKDIQGKVWTNLKRRKIWQQLHLLDDDNHPQENAPMATD